MSGSESPKLMVVDGLAIGLIVGVTVVLPVHAVMIAVVLLATRQIACRKPGQTSGWALFGVTVVVGGALVFAARPFESAMNAAIYILSLGLAEAIWVEHRFMDYTPPKKALASGLWPRIRTGLLWGLIVGLVVMGVAGAVIGAAEASGEGLGGRNAAIVLLAYPLLGLVVGALAGASLKLAVRPGGMVLLGAVAGAIVYGVFGVINELVDQTPIVLAEIAGLGLLCGLLVGPPVAFSYLTGE